MLIKIGSVYKLRYVCCLNWGYFPLKYDYTTPVLNYYLTFRFNVSFSTALHKLMTDENSSKKYIRTSFYIENIILHFVTMCTFNIQDVF